MVIALFFHHSHVVYPLLTALFFPDPPPPTPDHRFRYRSQGWRALAATCDTRTLRLRFRSAVIVTSIPTRSLSMVGESMCSIMTCSASVTRGSTWGIFAGI